MLLSSSSGVSDVFQISVMYTVFRHVFVMIELTKARWRNSAPCPSSAGSHERLYICANATEMGRAFAR
jgi:hypothetical protein